MGQLQDRVTVARLFEQFGPVVDQHQADRAGAARGVLRRAETRGLVRRVAKAAFVLDAPYVELDEWQQFRLRAMGFQMCAGDTTHLTGWAAALMHNLPTLGAAPAKPVALRPGDAHTASNATLYGRVRTGHLPPQHQTTRSGIRVVSPAYTVVDVARHFGATAGLMVADTVMARGVHREVLALLTEQMERYPGISTARWVVEHADPGAESPLETLGRMAFLSCGREAPVSNVWIVAGGRRFRVDHYLPASGVVIEGDGAGKFNNRENADEVVTNQNERERLLRLLGLGLVRYNYALALNQPRELVRRADDETRRVAPTFRAVPWSFERPAAGMKVARM